MDDPKDAANGEKVVETYYEERESKSFFRNPGRVLCACIERVQDDILRAIPVEVTEHLANSRKELLRAGVAFAESRIRKADETVQRARDLHTAN